MNRFGSDRSGAAVVPDPARVDCGVARRAAEAAANSWGDRLGDAERDAAD